MRGGEKDHSQKAYLQYGHACGYQDGSFEQNSLHTAEGYTYTCAFSLKQSSGLPRQSMCSPMMAAAARELYNQGRSRVHFCRGSFAAETALGHCHLCIEWLSSRRRPRWKTLPRYRFHFQKAFLLLRLFLGPRRLDLTPDKAHSLPVGFRVR